MPMPKAPEAPPATRWTLDAVGADQRRAVNSIVLLLCPTLGSKGTGFLVDGGLIVTTAHVVAGARPSEVVGVDVGGNHVAFRQVWLDPRRDLAALRPSRRMPGGLTLAEDDAALQPGMAVSTWGYPLGHVGTTPLLSVGYLAGFAATGSARGLVKQLVVNGAFNAGNSGGPLFRAGDGTVVGVVASKHAPMSPFVSSALEALSSNPRGSSYTARNAQGEQREYVESQLVAEVLTYLHGLAQVMIGQAVCASEVRRFLHNVERRERDKRARHG
jgi:hypothetical protein